MFTRSRMEGLWPQQTRHYSTENKPFFNTMPSSAGFLNKFNINVDNIAAQKRFVNPNFVVPQNRNVHSCPSKFEIPRHQQPLTQKCSEFIVKTNSSSVPSMAPNVLFNTDKRETKENTHRKKEYKHSPSDRRSRQSPRKEHKNKINMELKYEIDEVGVDVLSDDFESNSNDNTPTADLKIPPVFIHEAMPECAITTEIYNIPSPPICITIGTPENISTVVLSISTENCNRRRMPSDCCSEDSFIVFQCDTEDGDCDDDSSDCDVETESENEEDAESLCSDDGFTTTDEDCSKDSSRITKKVTFADDLTKVYPMIKWSYAYQAARKGQWEEYARDRGRFKDRISKISSILTPILQPDHRQQVFRERYE